jgi:OFA family oxalate/formate antiporter-like MFS transporter
MKRYVVLIAAVVMQMCLGPIYAWSTFVPALQQTFGYSSRQTQLVFGTSFLVFTTMGVFAGRILDRFGPRVLSVFAGASLGSGYLLASLRGDCFPLLWLGVGGLGGLGIASGYYCAVATPVKWFPRHKGLIGGLAVGGYGASAIVLTNVAKLLFDRGWAVLEIFQFVGLVYGPIIMLMGLLLFSPPDTHHHEVATFRRRTLLRDRQFWALCIAILCGNLPGQVVSGNLRPMGSFFHLSETVALQAITAFAIGNAVGRVFGGFAHDKLGGRRALISALGMVALSILSLIGAGLSGYGWLASAGLVGFCYGCNLGLYPAHVADLYGAHLVGTVYALAMLAHGVGGQIGPFLAGWAKDATGSFLPALAGICCVALAGMVIFAWLSRPQPPVPALVPVGEKEQAEDVAPYG